MPLEPISFIREDTTVIPDNQNTLEGSNWVRVNEHSCTFELAHFYDVTLNQVKHPNLNSSVLFRADIYYDSKDNELVDAESSKNTAVNLNSKDPSTIVEVKNFRVVRRIVRQLIPRNPQLDRPVAQTCLFMENEGSSGFKEAIVLLLPHVSCKEDMPWYHPAVKAVAYWYSSLRGQSLASQHQIEDQNTISIHYQLFPNQQLPLDRRLLRTALRLLEVLHKHGQGRLIGYEKQGRHDQLISQKRVQDTYSELKAKHAKRLCSAWVEKTEPSKHVFEDLGIAAFLIELWKDMYSPIGDKVTSNTNKLPSFPGFVDIGCGNGVLTEILILSGYPGHGFDARRRKTWSILSPRAQANLHETLFVPQPLFDLYPPPEVQSRAFLVSRSLAMFRSFGRPATSSLEPPKQPWHNGVFRTGTFIISNHADELTPWTPLLACLSSSPFLAIPCCSHNLSGARFRAPSMANANTADQAAPAYFDAQKPKKPLKSIPITIHSECEDDESEPVMLSGNCVTVEYKPDGLPQSQAAETGDLKSLTQKQRSKQLSAYASLCEWVAHLAQEAGYVVERDQLRIPSTRNIGLIGRRWTNKTMSTMQGYSSHSHKGTTRNDEIDSCSVSITGAVDTTTAATVRKETVARIVATEGADGIAWVNRCSDVLAQGGGVVHGRE